MFYNNDQTEPLDVIGDERLRLIFTCCHPALSMEARVALTLRMAGGLTVVEIARAFLMQETTMGQRITRAKAKIRLARIPYRTPSVERSPGPSLRSTRCPVPRIQRGLLGDWPRPRSHTSRPDR